MARVWLGRDWQDYCMLLLHRRYAIQNMHSLQLVPDRDQGDLGMEAFAHDGCIYQCYAPEEPLDTKKRYAKHRDKWTWITPKTFRKSVETAVERGADIEAAAAQLGHSRSSVTAKHYVEVAAIGPDHRDILELFGK